MKLQIKSAWEVTTLVLMAALVAMHIPAFGVLSWSTSDLGSMLSGFGSVIQAAVIGYVAHIGFAQWRKQKLGERQIDAAQSALVVAIEARNAIADIRSSYISFGESQAAKALLSERGQIDDSTPKDEVGHLVHSQCILTRMSRYNELWKRLVAVLPVAEVVLGQSAEKSLRELLILRREIEVAAEVYPIMREKSLRGVMQSIPEREEGELLDRFAVGMQEVIDGINKQLTPLLRAD